MYALISRVMVRHFNAAQCKDILMPVPIHAAVMLGHALGARLGKPVSGVALIMHAAHLEEEWLPKIKGAGERVLANKRGAATYYVEKPHGGGYASTSGLPTSMSYQMHATASGCFSLILDFGDASITAADVEAELIVMRWAGGTFQNTPRIIALETLPALLEHVSSGYLVMDAAERAERALAAGLEPAHVFLHRHAGGYVVPAVVGYHLLTPLSAKRKGIRLSPDSDIRVEGHAFAESITGLIQFRHINHLKYGSTSPASEAQLPAAPSTDDSSSAPAQQRCTSTSFTSGISEAFDISSDAESEDRHSPLAYDTDTPLRETSIFWHHGWSDDDTSFLIRQQPKH